MNIIAWIRSSDPALIKFLRETNDLLEKRVDAQIAAEEAVETSWAELIVRIDAELARLGVHPGTATLN
jgi:hypothetical protein